MLCLGDRFASQHLAPGRLNSTTHNPRVVPSQSPRDAKRARCGLFPADMVTISGCPSAAHTTARPAPILPLVISTTGAPGFSRPSARAASMMARAERSFTLPPGCMNSALARIRPGPLQTRDNSNTGVRPMRPAALAVMRLESSIVTRFCEGLQASWSRTTMTASGPFAERR